MDRKINIAIDGYSSCGKGTLAKMLARSLGYLFIDTGAMYRAVTLAIIRYGIDPADTAAVAAMLPTLEISFRHNPEQNFYNTYLNGEDVESQIRSMDVSQLVSPVSRIESVRHFLVKQQQQLGRNKGVVMDGRDIGTVVFPDAELKIFMTARPEVRAQRRFKELQQNGDTTATYQQVLDNLNARDLQDSTRANSPLKQAADARVIDNSELTREQQFQLALNMAEAAIRG